MVIKKEKLLPFPPEKIWKALTDPSVLSSWLMVTDFKAEVGQRFYFSSCGTDTITGEVLEIIALKKLVYSWNKVGMSPTILTWSLQEMQEGTVLRLEHDGFDDSSTTFFDSHNAGWSVFLEYLEKFLKKPTHA